jgi:hypothetical protein
MMLFADWFGDALVPIFVVGAILCWGIGQMMKSVGDALNSDTARDAARMGLWMFLLSDDDDDDD